MEAINTLVVLLKGKRGQLGEVRKEIESAVKWSKSNKVYFYDNA
jgi:hypothetical protein